MIDLKDKAKFDILMGIYIQDLLFLTENMERAIIRLLQLNLF